MRIEEELFANHLTCEEKLVDYGFHPQERGMVYTKYLPREDFRIVIAYDGAFSGKIEDLSIHEEYTNFRLANAAGFSAEIRQQFVDLLLDIRTKCCKNQFFYSVQARRINAYIEKAFSGAPEFLWPKLPSFAAYRMDESKKWYAIIGSVPRNKVDHASSSAREVEVLNVKVDNGKIQQLLAREGLYPAYHMNKKHWVSIILDDTLADAEIQEMLRYSFDSVLKP